MIADDLAIAQDPTFNITYYNILWQNLEHLTTITIHKAILDLSSLWRTAWDNAGSPSPLSIQSNNHNPEIYFLAKNYPNPFNSTTTIAFTLPQSVFITLKIYNILGGEIASLVDKKLQAGNHTYTFDGSNLASGVYLYRIEAGEFQDMQKMILIK